MKFCECRPAVVYLSFFVLLYFFSSSYLVNFIKIVFYLYLYYSICICICSIIIVFVCALVFVSYFLDGVNGLLCRPASHSCSHLSVTLHSRHFTISESWKDITYVSFLITLCSQYQNIDTCFHIVCHSFLGCTVALTSIFFHQQLKPF